MPASKRLAPRTAGARTQYCALSTRTAHMQPGNCAVGPDPFKPSSVSPEVNLLQLSENPRPIPVVGQRACLGGQAVQGGRHHAASRGVRFSTGAAVAATAAAWKGQRRCPACTCAAG